MLCFMSVAVATKQGIIQLAQKMHIAVATVNRNKRLYDTNAAVEALVSAKPLTRTSYADRLKVTKGYVNYVRGLYRRWFNGVHGRPPTSPNF